MTEACDGWSDLERRIVSCERCPRLTSHRRAVATAKRRAFRGETYWGKPVPGFGDRDAFVLFVGLAPAAHGANRTGRMFTGDDSGRWLYASLHRAGFANRPESTGPGDGLELRGAFITATCRCAPPDNKPTPDEMAACAPYLDEEFARLDRLRVIVALGKIAWDAVWRHARRRNPGSVPRPVPAFSHGASANVTIGPTAREVRLLASYHPSRQNTQTGRLTRPMLDAVTARAAALAFPRRAPARRSPPVRR